VNINKVFDYDDFSSPEFVEARAMTGSGLHRKSWENLIMTYGFKRLGCFDSGKTALGLGCLVEPLIFLYSNHFSHTYATDVAYYPKKFWGKDNFSPEQVYCTAKIPYDRSKLTVLPMDMKKLDFDSGSVDVVWSSSSVEHVGVLEDVLRCFSEVERVLKPNGICGMTVEWNLDYQDKIIKFYNVLCFNMRVLDEISKRCPKLALVEPMTLDRSDNPKNREPEFLRGKTHFPVHKGHVDFTSASIFWRKCE
jgi:SAM-dependent methyltransferase